jgi:hypothetical protein
MSQVRNERKMKGEAGQPLISLLEIYSQKFHPFNKVYGFSEMSLLTRSLYLC